MRLAWFSPWPPQPSGVAGRSAALVPALAGRGHGIDVFVDEQRVAAARRASDMPPAAGAVRVQSAHDFVWRNLRDQYDLIVYQIGNSRQHAFVWPYLFRWPGLTVLHDARLHHARGHAWLSRRRSAEYRAEFRLSQPDASPDAAELAVRGFDGAYYYLWPMTRAVALASRLVGVHTRGGADELRSAVPDRPVEYIALSSGRLQPSTDAERRATRAALGYDDSAVVYGVFGGLTPEKRLPEVLHAFRWTHARLPTTRLLLAGEPAPGLDVPALTAALGLADAVTWHPALDDDAFERAIGAVDVAIGLRWPTAVETSGPWLQALADRRATITTALAHLAHVPALDPRSWQPWTAGDPDAPVTVAVDLLDEDHSLRLAMARLAADPALRAALGDAGRAYWEREHSMIRMIDDYERAIARAAAAPVPDPVALTPPPAAATRALLAGLGDVSCELF
ncbi:MAG: glycosyltransferase family 4 protein [Acidobacteria bacterium]|nr:glycosyltransferase family 4 protein [Acidobacteriota bacterium]